MYSNKLAVAIKHRGKVLQEFGETVYLPFGSEYGILIKNLNSVRASVKISIDGQDISEGINLVVMPNSSIEVERFVKNGNLKAGNRFKFIERNAAVTAHRGARIDDGVIKVEWSFEVVQSAPIYYHHQPYQAPFWNGSPTWSVSGSTADVTASSIRGSTCGSLGSSDISHSCSVSGSTSVVQNATGITAPGSVSHQQFQTTGWFQTETVKYVIAFKLAGESAQSGTVQSVVYTRTKVDCTICGAIHKPSAKFCSQCGASLNIIK